MSNSNESYIREHKLKQLMEFLMEQLLNKKPSNPEKYLIKILERRQSLLAEKPKTVSFKSFCMLKTAFLRVVQTQAILFLKSMSERVGSDIKRLIISMTPYSIDFETIEI